MMTTQQTDLTRAARVLALAGAADMVLGLILAGLAFAGVVRGGLMVAVLGLVVALAGVGLLMWARHKAGQDMSSGSRN